jgi:hypothetical protein
MKWVAIAILAWHFADRTQAASVEEIKKNVGKIIEWLSLGPTETQDVHRVITFSRADIRNAAHVEAVKEAVKGSDLGPAIISKLDEMAAYAQYSEKVDYRIPLAQPVDITPPVQYGSDDGSMVVHAYKVDAVPATTAMKAAWYMLMRSTLYH